MLLLKLLIGFVLQEGGTALMEASGGGYAEIVSALLAAKADPNLAIEVSM